MPISLGHFEVARHEAAHASYGAMVQLNIVEVHVEPSKGHVQWSSDFPMPDTLPRLWNSDPVATESLVRWAVGATLAPHNGEKFPGPCPDASMIGGLARAWQRLPSVKGHTPVPWTDLTRAVRLDVWTWAHKPGVDFALDMLAHRLARVGTVDASGWQAIWKRDFCAPLRAALPAAITWPVRRSTVAAPVRTKPHATVASGKPVRTPRWADGVLPVFDWRVPATALRLPIHVTC